MKKLLLTLLMICGLMRVPLAAHTAPAADVASNDAAMYMLNGGDVLNIQVFDNPELSSPKEGGVETNPYVVRPDGYFAMPLIGDINVNNKSTFDVTNEITAKLSEYLKNPIVTINIMKEGSTRVYVLGEVKRQGMYELNKKHNLLDVCSHIHIQRYGTPKSAIAQRHTTLSPMAILIDDEARNRVEWWEHEGTAIDPTETNLIEELQKLAQARNT